MNVETFECPKCFGKGTLRHFKHVEAGVCFLCEKTGTVSREKLNGWLASHLPKVARSYAAPAPKNDGLKRKTVNIGTLGSCRIVRYGDGEMRIDLDEYRYVCDYDEVAGGMWLVFRVVGGKIKVTSAPAGLSCSPRRMGHVVGEITAALRS